MTSNPAGDGFTRGFDQLPPNSYEPDPALAGYPPPQNGQTPAPIELRPAGTGTAVRILAPVPDIARLPATKACQRYA